VEHLGQFSISTSSLSGSVFGQRLHRWAVKHPFDANFSDDLIEGEVGYSTFKFGRSFPITSLGHSFNEKALVEFINLALEL
jgi:hypothetical protein